MILFSSFRKFQFPKVKLRLMHGLEGGSDLKPYTIDSAKRPKPTLVME
jgi:hypothetical protein